MNEQAITDIKLTPPEDYAWTYDIMHLQFVPFFNFCAFPQINECEIDDLTCGGGQCKNTPGSFQVILNKKSILYLRVVMFFFSAFVQSELSMMHGLKFVKTLVIAFL